MEVLVYERKLDTRGDLIRRTVDAATGINDQDILRRVAHSVVKWARMCVETEGEHCEDLVKQ
jgi:hypothetical protein